MASASHPPKPDAWDRLDGESDPAWRAFVEYRDLGIERSVAAAAKKVGKSRQMLAKWSRAHSWLIRVSAYDREQDRIRNNALRAAAHRNANRLMGTSEALLKVAGNALLAYGQDEKKVAAMKPLDIARLAEVGAKLQTAAIGQSTIVHPGRPGGPAGDDTGVSTDHIAALSDEDRVVRMRQIVAELNTRIGDREEAMAAS